MASLHEVVGAKYRIVSLHSVTARMSRLLSSAAGRRQPSTSLLITSDGRRFKLLQAPNPEDHRRIRDTLPLVDTLEFVPRVVWSDSRRLLVEYVDGTPPDVRSSDFADKVARLLANLHSVAHSRYSLAELQEEIRSCLHRLQEDNLLVPKCASELEARLRTHSQRLGETLPSSLVYADIKPNNFVVDRHDRLHAVDLGGFKSQAPTDEYLFGSRCYEWMDRPKFRSSYLAGGGNEEIFDGEVFLRVANQVRFYRYYTRLYARTSALDWPRRRQLRSINTWLRDRIERGARGEFTLT